jgi:tetratricopeptide (TPR) repeat protein
VFAVVNSLLGKRPWAAGAGALLFAMHPVQVEPVAWVSGMNNLICATFALLALWLYIRFAQTGRWSWYIGATCAFVLALFAKPVALVVPIVAFVIDVGLVRHSWRSAIRSLLLWAVLATPFVVITRMVQPAASIEPAPWMARPLVALDSIAFYLSKLLVPIDLAADYGRTPQVIMDRGYILWTWLAPAALAFVCWRWRKTLPWLWPAALVFVCAMLPVLGLTVFEFQNYSTVADRYMYLAMLGPAIAVAFVLAQWPTRTTIVVAALLLVVAGVLTSMQLRVWRDTYTLFQSHVMRINPTSLAASKAMAFSLMHDGKPEEALKYFDAGLRTNPRDVDLNFNLANLMAFNLARPADALAYYERALEGWPTNPKIHNNYGIALYQAGRKADALSQYDRALRLDSHYSHPHANLGIYYIEAGDLSAAEKHFRKALELQPGFIQAQRGLRRVEELRGAP